jgi:hypothetical protein
MLLSFCFKPKGFWKLFLIFPIPKQLPGLFSARKKRQASTKTRLLPELAIVLHELPENSQFPRKSEVFQKTRSLPDDSGNK